MNGDLFTKVLAWLIVIGAVLLLFAVALGIRLLITGGDWGCVFAQDPGLCVAVKQVGQ